MGNFNLTEAAKEILDANVASKKGGQEHGVGDSALKSTVAYGTHDSGLVGQSPEKKDDTLPDYLKGTPSATPPGATPPVGSEKDGVGYESPKGQPQETQGRADLRQTAQKDATDYENIRDRKKYSAPAQTFHMNPGATFQSYGEDIDAMLSGENLSEEFKEKAALIFEAAVNSRANEVIESVQQDLQEQFEIAVEEIKEELATKVDDYLDYMIEEWIKENELAINSGLRSEVVEDFMVGLRNLFIEHHIDIPEDKVNVVEELVSKVEELESELNEQIASAVEMNKIINEHKKFEAIYAACEGLTQTQVEKIKSLAESIEFTDEDDFSNKLETIKESYIGGKTFKAADSSALDDEVQIVEEKKTGNFADPEMAIYSKVISQSLNK
jgi:hypothetical protein